MKTEILLVLRTLANAPRDRGQRTYARAEELEALTGLPMDKLSDVVRLLQADGLAESNRQFTNAPFSPTQITPRGRLAMEEMTLESIAESSAPGDLADSLARFTSDFPDATKVGFIVMPFGSTNAHSALLTAIRATLESEGLRGVRADDREYHPEVLGNVRTYLHGCSFAIAVFERIETDVFNPNVSLEVGYMLALGKPVCLLKDRTLRTLQTDLVGRLYREFDTQDPAASIPGTLRKWLKDRSLSREA